MIFHTRAHQKTGQSVAAMLGIDATHKSPNKLYGRHLQTTIFLVGGKRKTM
jgi:hypothetical protein